MSVQALDDETIGVYFDIEPTYKLYQSRFKFWVDEGQVDFANVTFPEARVEFDDMHFKTMPVYRDSLLFTLPVTQADPATPISSFLIEFQGCADAGLCYAPEQVTIPLSFDNGLTAHGPFAVNDLAPKFAKHIAQQYKEPASNPSASPTTSSTINSESNHAEKVKGEESVFALSDKGLANYLANTSWSEAVVLAFAFGLFLSFTPCVLPMVPILLSILAGQEALKDADNKNAKSQGFKMALAYVAGMSIVYTALGLGAAMAGASLAALLQTPWVLGGFALVLAILSLSMFDVFTLQMPAGIQSRLQGRMGSLSGGKFGHVFIMGMFSALVVGPCIAAPLAGVLLFIAQSGDLLLGGSALFALAWGSGAILLLVGATSGALMPRAGMWMVSIKYGFGLLLLGTAWWMVQSVVPSTVHALGWAALGIWAGIMFKVFAWNTAAHPLLQLAKALGVILVLWCVFIVASVASGQRVQLFAPLATLSLGSGSAIEAQAPALPFTPITSLQGLYSAIEQSEKPVMIDFYADWCTSCIEMETFTFSDPSVYALMERMTLLQVDVTQTSPDTKALLQEFDLFGPPGILFFDEHATLLPERVIGFAAAPEFAKTLQSVLGN